MLQGECFNKLAFLRTYLHYRTDTLTKF